jgi:hypothetical protein
MTVYSDLVQKSIQEKMSKLRETKFYSPKLELPYVKVTSDGYLKSSINRISSIHKIELPMNYRRKTIYQRTADSCGSIEKGNISGTTALKKCMLNAGIDSEARGIALDASKLYPPLHHALAKAWGLEADNILPSDQQLTKDVPCIAKQDYFHTREVAHTKILKDSQATNVILKLEKAKAVYMNSRFVNDPSRFMEDTGMFSFMIPGTKHAYHFFPDAQRCLSPQIMKQLAEALAAKRLYVWNQQRHVAALAKLDATAKDCICATSHELLTKTTGNFPSKIYVAATGHHHCTATYINVFRNPQDVSDTALNHIGAELCATAILYPNLTD